MTQEPEPFEELSLPRRNLDNLSELRYRVYKDAKNYEVVEAVSALDALQKSSIAKAYKIERHNPLADNVLHLSVIRQLQGINDEDIIDSHVSEILQETPAHHAHAPVSDIVKAIAEHDEKVEEALADPAPLSNEDVDKLLNS